MTLLRPQNVAAASVRTAEGTAVGEPPTSGTLPGWALGVAVWLALCLASSAGGASAETRATALRRWSDRTWPR
jgi:hypothetical protein